MTPHVALIGQEVTRHEEFFFRCGRRGVLAYQGWNGGDPLPGAQPFACLLTWPDYQRAKSLGELEDPLLVPPHVALRDTTTDPDTMKKTPTDPPEPLDTIPVYLVLSEHLMWGGKKYRRGELIRTLAQGVDGRRKEATYLKKEWMRQATPEEIAAAENTAPATKAPATNIVKPHPVAFAGVAEQPAEEAGDGKFALLDPQTIAPGPTNPRQEFAEEPMAQLTASVRTIGVRTPIHVRKVSADAWVIDSYQDGPKNGYQLRDTRRKLTVFAPEIMRLFFDTREEAVAALPQWEIIAGERRWRAARRAEVPTIRAIVESQQEGEASEWQALENLQRADLNAVEEAGALRYLLARPGYSIERLVQVTGLKKNTIWGKLKILEAPEAARKEVESGKLSASIVEQIGRQDEEIREEATRRIIEIRKGGFRDDQDKPATYKEAERIIDNLKNEQKQERLHREAVEAAQGKGLTVLTGEEADGVFHYGSEVSPNCGYVDAGDKCPRNPNGRTWGQVCKDQAGVTSYAVIHWMHRDEVFKITRLYKREEANAALKRLGLWSAEGSKKAREMEAQREKKAKHGRDHERAQNQLDALVERAANAAVAPVLRVALSALIKADPDACYHAAKRLLLIPAEDMTWTNKGKAQTRLRELIQAGTIKVLSELVADLGAISLAKDQTYFADGIQAVAALLGMDAPPSGEEGRGARADVRTDYDPETEQPNSASRCG